MIPFGRTAAERERDAVWDAIEDDKAVQRWWCVWGIQWWLIGRYVRANAKRRLEYLLLAEREEELATEPDEPEGNYDCGVEPDRNRTLGTAPW